MENVGGKKLGEWENPEENLKMPTLPTKIDPMATRLEFVTPVAIDKRSNCS